MQEIKFRFYDPDEHKMFDVLNIEFEGRPSVVLQRRPTIRRPIDFGYLMQFTGLEDKNGVEIYDGDIVKYGVFALNDRRHFGETPWENLPDGVKEDDITFTINTVVVEYDISFLEKLRVAITANPDVQGVEVVGNIHENPELVGES